MKNVFRIAFVMVLALGAVVAQTASDYTQVVEMLELSGHQGAVYTVVWNPDSKSVVSGSADKSARVWNLVNGRVSWEVKQHLNPVFFSSYSPDGKYLVSASTDRVTIWNLAEKVEYKTFRLGIIKGVTVSPDFSSIAIAFVLNNEHKVKVFNTFTMAEKMTLQTNLVVDSIWSSTNFDTISIVTDEVLHLFDPSNGVEFRKIIVNGSIVGCVFSKDSKSVSISYLNNITDYIGIQKFELPSAKLLKEIKFGSSGATETRAYPALALSPDGNVFALGSQESIKLISADSLNQLKTLDGHESSVFDLSFSPDGKFLASASADRTVKIWGISSGVQIFGQPSSNPTQTQDSTLGSGKQVLGSSPTPSTPTAVVTPATTPTVPAVTSASSNVKPRDGVYGLIIGIGKYKSSAVAPLEYAVSDAKRFAAALTKTSAGGVNPANVTMLLDGDATKSAIEARVKRLAAGLKRGETLIVYFSGHGAPSAAGEALLVPWDADKDYLEDTAIGLSDLQARAAGAGRVVFILDSCFSGEGRSILAPGTRPFGVQVNLSAAPTSAGGGSVSVFSASRANETSNESTALQAGYFTFYLVQGLEGAADTNKDGQVTLQEAQLYAQSKVSEAVKRERGSNQNPELRGDGGLVLGQNLELAVSLGLVARVSKVKALADAGKLSGRQFLALKQLVDEKREPADLRDFLDGKLPEKDFLELVYQGFFESAGVPSGRP